MHASVCGQRDGRQPDAGSMQFRCTHLISVLDAIGISPEHGFTGTTSRGDLEGPRSGWQQPGNRIFSRHEAPEHRGGSRRDHCTLGATTARKFCGPGSQPARPPTMHHDGGSLTQRASKVDVARLGDPARDVSLNPTNSLIPQSSLWIRYGNGANSPAILQRQRVGRDAGPVPASRSCIIART